MSREDIWDQYPDEEFIFADGYDDAILGVDNATPRVIYSTTKCIETLVANEGMTEEEAVDYFYYNTIRANAYMGDKAPIFCEDGY